jgi:hypothetical protein
MTLREFLDALRAIDDRTWRVNHYGQIESVEDCLCPIHDVWLASEEGQEEHMLEDWGQEAERLGLSPRVAKTIVRAADNVTKGAMRAKLLDACGLAPKGATQ